MAWFGPNDCGCECDPCDPFDCGDGTSQQITQITWNFSGIPALLYYWFTDGLFWYRVNITGFDQVNGSHIITRGPGDCSWSYFPLWEASYTMDIFETSGCPGPLSTSSLGDTLAIQLVHGCTSSTIEHDIVLRVTESGNVGTDFYIPGTAISINMNFAVDGTENRCGTTNLHDFYPTSIGLDGYTCEVVEEEFVGTAVSSP